MKRLIINAIAFFILMLISSGSFAQSKDEMKSLVAKMNKEMMDLVKTGRYEAMGKYYDESAISLPNYRAMEKGYKLILSNNLGRKQGGYQVLDGQKTTTELILGNNIMVDIGTYTLTLNFPGLTQPKVDNGKYLNVWKKDNEGAWKIVAETWNADKSPNAPSQSKGQPTQTPGPSINPNPGTGTQSGAPGGTNNQSQTGTDQKPVMDTKEGKK
jgi:ketosteroid isomerase-like protein